MNSLWRNSCLKPRIFGLDAKLSILFLACLMHVREWTLIVVILVIAVFVIIEIWRKISIEVAIRFLRSSLAGSYRPAWIGQDKKISIDYGYAEMIAKSRIEIRKKQKND